MSRKILVYAVIAGVLAVSAGAWIFARMFAELNQPRSIPILMYHSVGETNNSAWVVPAETFRAHMAGLREQGFTTIMPADISAHFKWSRPLPSKPVMITFDDGYLCNLTVIEPILKANGLRAVIYLITGQVAKTTADRREYEGKKCLVWPEVAAMQQRGTFAFGGHSHSHFNLAASGNPLPDIAECMRQLKQHGIRNPYAFCYPFGQYNQNTVKAVQEAGFKTAVVCEDALAVIGPGTNLLTLPRVSVMGGSHEFKLLNRAIIAGDNKMIYRVEHIGIPLEISACLRADGNEKTGQKVWLPARAVAEGEFSLQFTLPGAGKGQALNQLEIWDKHRLFKLATVNPDKPLNSNIEARNPKQY
jgi:peptidoglycan/xylan/chitin deacetylase (PgdA/CDA1 family)